MNVTTNNPFSPGASVSRHQLFSKAQALHDSEASIWDDPVGTRLLSAEGDVAWIHDGGLLSFERRFPTETTIGEMYDTARARYDTADHALGKDLAVAGVGAALLVLGSFVPGGAGQLLTWAGGGVGAFGLGKAAIDGFTRRMAGIDDASLQSWGLAFEDSGLVAK